MFKLCCALIRWSCATVLPGHVAGYWCIPLPVLDTVLQLVSNGVYVGWWCGQLHHVHALLADISCLCALLAWVPRLCNDVLPAAGATRHQRPCPHACTARPHHCLQVLSLGLEPPGCRSGPRSTFLVGCVVISLSQRIIDCSVRHIFVVAYAIQVVSSAKTSMQPHILTIQVKYSGHQLRLCSGPQGEPRMWR